MRCHRTDGKAQQTATVGLYNRQMRGKACSARLLHLSADRPFIREVVDCTSRRVSMSATSEAPSRSLLSRWRLHIASLLSSELLLLVHRSEDGRGRQVEQTRPWLRLWTRVAGCVLT
ncbi:uncharacterized protein TRIVIDRAFT_214459 [Trichoderma virens Gv29-8]|uniref:Uncharacterized protein n=1 Tax=Hypocrea virens (strain Gv29-8 / FGSC 10586) TaxID=413071 RepID=G9N9E6_HYPVG|nr:uncharacterized protein TRIVIDRAFT_214459 [Trichoderma virens Gv29-8]EHK16566.1 hypothetical protein TRIVIDRAFT_214459 [Trichoderma virens Gv29-8]